MLDPKGDLPEIPTEKQHYVKLRWISINEQLWRSRKELFATHYTVYAMEADNLFESLYCLYWKTTDVSSSQRITRFEQWMSGKWLCGPMNRVFVMTPCKWQGANMKKRVRNHVPQPHCHNFSSSWNQYYRLRDVFLALYGVLWFLWNNVLMPKCI